MSESPYLLYYYDTEIRDEKGWFNSDIEQETGCPTIQQVVEEALFGFLRGQMLPQRIAYCGQTIWEHEGSLEATLDQLYVFGLRHEVFKEIG